MTHTEQHHNATDISTFGFWLYLMSDCVLFASLFATYIVLHNNTVSGPTGHDLFSLPFALHETLLLLTSSFTCGLMMLAAYRGKKNQVLAWLAATLTLGLSFITLELSEFSQFVHAGHGWTQSAFLSSYFTLVGTHGLHVTIGMLWMIFMMVRIATSGLTARSMRRLMCLSLFWHFLDIIWIFIFTIVYLMSAL